MRRFLKISVLFILLIFTAVINLYSQVLNNGSTSINLETKFLKHKMEITPEQPFFNILFIKNKSNKPVKFQLNFNIPEGWIIISEKSKVINLNIGDSIIVPVRASLDKEVKGEIGYSMVAALTDIFGNTIKNEYCFIAVPKKANLKFKSLSRLEYFDQKSKTAEVRLNIKNQGNVDENIIVEFEPDNDIEIPNRFDNSFIVNSKSDTILSYNVRLKHSETLKQNYKVKVFVSSPDTTFKSTIWFAVIENKFENNISESMKPLVAELRASNLFSVSEPTYSTFINGNLLLMNNYDLYYYLRYNRNTAENDIWKYSRTWIGLKKKFFDIRVGDVEKPIIQPFIGRGAYLGLNYNDNMLGGHYTTNMFRNENNLGVVFSKKIGKKINLNAAYSSSNDQDRQIIKSGGSIGGSYQFFNKQNISGGFIYSTQHFIRSNYTANGYGLSLNLSGRFNKFNYRSRLNYGSPKTITSFKGKLQFENNFTYRISNYTNLAIMSNINHYSPPRYSTDYDSIITKQYSAIDNYYMTVNQIVNSRLNFNFSLYYTDEYSNTLGNSFNPYSFGVNQYSGKGGFFLRLNSNNTISSSFKLNYVINDHIDKNLLAQKNGSLSNKKYIASNFIINYRSKLWGVYFNYFYGPNSLYEKYRYLTSNTLTKTIRIQPYFNRYLYKRIIKLEMRGNYLGAISTNFNRYNIASNLIFNLNNNWEGQFVTTFTRTQKYDNLANENLKFNSSYFEFLVRKEFNFNQPRVKFHDLKVVFYKDLNGDRKKQPNEPGIRNVMVNFDKKTILKETDVEFTYTDLLSNHLGEIEYLNMPQGEYLLTFNTIGKDQGNFAPDFTFYNLKINKNITVYVPFLENNKIFGKIIMNRSKISNLGNIDIANIKITALDSEGNVTTTLTNKEGKFVLYVPNVDKYVVSINNIFYEHFDLRQNHYEVQLNGYKQFEVNFIFDEKQRKINFSPSLSIEDFEIKRVRRTNLTGVIKDENSLQPIRAKIEIYDNKTNTTIATIHSDRNDGRFSISYISGDNYSMYVTKDDYWFYAEKLYMNQLTTIQNLKKDIVLKPIIIGSKLELNYLYFTPQSSEIPPEAYPELNKLINQLKNNSNIRIQIAGHSDDLETIDNEKISEERAKSVSKYMINNGFSNIEFVGLKNSQPADVNDTEESRKNNRRVEIIVIDK